MDPIFGILILVLTQDPRFVPYVESVERRSSRTIWPAARVETWESHLVGRAQRGDELAFEMLMDLHGQAIRGHALRLLRNHEDAEDASQETFVKAYRALSGFDANRAILPWLMRICSNCCIDIVRQRKRIGEPLENFEHILADTGDSVEDSVEARQSARSIQEAINRLPARYREIIRMRHEQQMVRMRHEQQMAVGDIAVATGAPEGTVKSWLFRARAHLAKDLQIELA